MSWGAMHRESERLASEAESLVRLGHIAEAGELYLAAAVVETKALDALALEKVRTRGITAVSATALWYKGHDLERAESIAAAELAKGGLPKFAQLQLRDLLQLIWRDAEAQQAGVRFVPGEVLVSVKGGEVVQGGAPLDLIASKVSTIESMLMRTVEMLQGIALRRRGAPTADIQAQYRPWLFQTLPGSYQFVVRLQEPLQRSFLEDQRPQVAQVTETFFGILRATSGEPDAEIAQVVTDPDYQSAFLRLSRNLAPTGKSFDRIEISDASSPSGRVVSFEKQTRSELNQAIRTLQPVDQHARSEILETFEGILRGLQLDKDWLEINLGDGRSVRVTQAGDILDDVIGPMVNHPVSVTVLRNGVKLLYRDIEMLDE